MFSGTWSDSGLRITGLGYKAPGRFRAFCYYCCLTPLPELPAGFTLPGQSLLADPLYTVAVFDMGKVEEGKFKHAELYLEPLVICFR